MVEFSFIFWYFTDPRADGVVADKDVSTGYSGTSLALAIVFSIILSLAIGFLAGFFFSVKHSQRKHNNLSPPALADIGTVEKNKNVYVEPPVKTVENNIQEKQINVMYNPVKPNNKLPNGGADLQVSPKKVYV